MQIFDVLSENFSRLLTSKFYQHCTLSIAVSHLKLMRIFLPQNNTKSVMSSNVCLS